MTASDDNTKRHEVVVVTTFRRQVEIRLASGERRRARIKGRQMRPVCGDSVIASPMPGEPEWLIHSITERKNELGRPDTRGRREVLAANLSLVAVVASDPPAPDWFVVDRYLSAAELMPARAAVIFNKTDLAQHTQHTEVLAEYERIGYPVVPCSAKADENLAAVAALLNDEVAILVGQSGVGKSSLINALLDDAGLATAPVSDKSGEGRHTTVNSAMLELPGGGAVIDSPGVRDYAPAIERVEQVATGFREIVEHSRYCRYADCRHLREPGCAVKSAVADGGISARRYESYKRLRRITENLTGDNRNR